MVVKKIKNPKKSASKAARIGGLSGLHSQSRKQKCKREMRLFQSERFFDGHPQSQKAEMLALSQEAVRSKDTVNHYVISWQEGEQPSHQQIDEAVSIFLDELGLNDHQTVYGLHADTDNLHLHLVINRVHPEYTESHQTE